MATGPGFSNAAISCGLRREAAVDVPAWVIEPEDQSDYRIIAADEDEHAAAAFLRRKLAARRAALAAITRWGR
jgi:hypothetical protein